MARKAQGTATKERERKPVAPVPETPPPQNLGGKALFALATIGAALYALRLWFTPVKSPDLWFHMKIGEWIFNHRRLPTGDIFSSTHRGHDWIVNSWLSDLFFWAYYRLTGDNGILILELAFCFLLFSWVAWSAYRLCGRANLVLLSIYLAVVASYYRFTPRPELFTMLLMVLMLTILYDYKFRLSDRILWLVPMGILWPNLHMGFVAALAILGCFVVGEGAAALHLGSQRKAIPEDIISGARLTRLAWISVATMAGTSVNPYGWEAWTFVSKLTGQFGKIAEWVGLIEVAPKIEFTPLFCLALLALIAIGALLISRRSRDLSGLLLLGVFAYATLRFNRQITQFCIVAPFVMAGAMRGLPWRCCRRLSHQARFGLGAAGILALQGAVYLILVIWGIPEQVAGSPLGFGVDKTQRSDKAVQFIRENGLAGQNLFNSLELGGWVTWNLWPKQSVFIDGRVDMYGTDDLSRYMLWIGAKNLSNVLLRTGFDYCYFRYPQGSQLVRNPDWALVFFDDAGLIYARRDNRHAKLIAEREYKILNPLLAYDPGSEDLASQANLVLAEAERTRREAPDSSRAHLIAGKALLLIGRPKASIERLEFARKTAAFWPQVMLSDLDKALGSARVSLARSYAMRGDRSAALDQLEQAAKEDPDALKEIAEDDAFAAMRKEPRFMALMARHR